MASKFGGIAVDQTQSKFGGVPVGGEDDGDRPIVDSNIDNGGAGVEQGIVDDLVSGFNQLPGVPELQEIAAGANRSVADVIDFLGTDTINAILNVTGSEKRIPTVRESIPGIEGGFVEDGLKRDVLSAVGETAPAAIGIGSLLRSLSQKLPQLVAGTDTVGAGLLRQAGQTTARGDVALGGLAGAGQELGGAAGEELGGEEGRQVGEFVGGIAAPLAAIPIASAKSTATNLLKKSSPSVDQLKTTASGIYKSLDDSGVSIPSKQFDRLARDVISTLKKEGADINLTPEANAVIKRLTQEIGADKTLTEIDTLRKVAQGAASSNNANERRLGSMVVNKVDDFLNNLGDDVVGGKDAGQAFKSARDLWSRAKKAELLDQAVLNAKDQASGFENGLRTQFRQILKRINTGKERGFTKEETEAIRKVVNGTNAGNVARFLGKFGILDGVTSRSLTTLGGAGLAGSVGGTGAAAAVPIIGQVSGALAERMTLNNAKMASSIIRAGKNGAQIARIYNQNTPKSLRSPTELAELFIKNQVPVANINLKTANPLVADAAIIASVARANDKEESE